MDPSARWKPRLKTLRARLATRETLLQVTRDANATTEATKVAEWLVRQANSWLPAPCWAVVARDNSDRLTVMADSGLTPSLGPSLWSAAELKLHSLARDIANASEHAGQETAILARAATASLV